MLKPVGRDLCPPLKGLEALLEEDLDTPHSWAHSVHKSKNMTEALQTACALAQAQLEPGTVPDLVLVHVHCMYCDYEGQWETVVPTIRSSLPEGVKLIAGGTVAGTIGNQGPDSGAIEYDNQYSVGVTLARLPGVRFRTFVSSHNTAPHMFDEPYEWSRHFGDIPQSADPVFLVYPSPRYARRQCLDALLLNLDRVYPESPKIGSLITTYGLAASGVVFGWSSDPNSKVDFLPLWRASVRDDPDPERIKWVREMYDKGETPDWSQDGFLGIAMLGDIQARTSSLQGARPVSPVYRVKTVDGPRIVEMVYEEDVVKGVPESEMVVHEPFDEYYRLTMELDRQEAYLLQKQAHIGVEQIPLLQRGDEWPRKMEDGQEEQADADSFMVEEIAAGNFGTAGLTIGQWVKPGQRFAFYVRDGAAGREESASAAKRLAKETSAQTDESGFRTEGLLSFKGINRGKGFFGVDQYEANVIQRAGLEGGRLGGAIADAAIGALQKGATTIVFAAGTVLAQFSPKNLKRKAGKPLFSPSSLGLSDDSEEDAAELDAIPSAVGGKKERLPQPEVAYKPPSTDPDVKITRRDITKAQAAHIFTIQFEPRQEYKPPKYLFEDLVQMKESEIAKYRDRWPMGMLSTRVLSVKNQPFFKQRSLKAALKSQIQKRGWCVIGQMMKASPSFGVLVEHYEPQAFARSFSKNGAAAVSVMVDKQHYYGSYEDCMNARRETRLPIIADDIVVYGWQLLKHKTEGADASVVHANILTDAEIRQNILVAQKMDTEILVKVNSPEQLKRVADIETVDIVVLDNVNFWNLLPDRQRTKRLIEAAPEAIAKIRARGGIILSEGGIETGADMTEVLEMGVDGVSVGEGLLLEGGSPGKKLRRWIMAAKEVKPAPLQGVPA
uniref:indole-3-glycerol-phosphate synthase n=1 Tax=Chromera velia CCMP2878 TaxID=1169474 RepID=A0A0G4G1G1_9ALVE|eukprot:Cvel_19631.t1-p1 / transcript=Cvel_19631.t1 / gene=Cvel_19631 / organism=Chromera_velia_CCMP2878 / gene_product=Indole-3-glycerol phosphate synthase, putative / transcript_product=Indole-3-glycerol phosphate synthase, putative / location=Cvel_scaffold1709:2392-11743(-) / protein_length=893 / sequence_SO=supercontig / SO=protein_coding / is_pseudo=false